METPETRYVETASGLIAYQVVGDGPIDLVVQTPTFLPVDLMWDEPRVVRFQERLSSFSRTIWLDSPGRGASGPRPLAVGSYWEHLVDDVVAVLDVVGSARAAVFDTAGLPGMLLAATHPERTTALVLLNGSARRRLDLDYPEGLSDEEIEDTIARYGHGWGTGAQALLNASLVDDPRLVRWTARCERLSCTPQEAVWRMRAWLDADLRGVLPAISVPTLVLSRGEHPKYREMARYVASHIAGARFVQLPETDFFFFAGDTAGMLDVIEEFLTGRLASPVVDRVLATVLFTDVVGSTEQAAKLGDRRWKELLSDHDTIVRAEIERFRGREIKSTGDGFLATFDGPGRAILCACSIRHAVRGLGLDVRAGLHTGEIELRGDDITGIAVHIGQRVSALAGRGEVLVSSSVPPLVAGSGIEFDDRGEHELKGLPGAWRVFAVKG